MWTLTAEGVTLAMAKLLERRASIANDLQRLDAEIAELQEFERTVEAFRAKHGLGATSENSQAEAAGNAATSGGPTLVVRAVSSVQERPEPSNWGDTILRPATEAVVFPAEGSSWRLTR
jgi:hypothetical protein